MRLINRDTDYAVRALCFIAKQKEEVISVSSLVKELKIPRPFLRKLLQTLNREGLLISYKGKGGGFILSARPNKITLIDLIEVFQGPLQLSEHMFKKKKCPKIKVCRLKNILDKIEKDLIKKLKLITISSVVK